MKHAFGIAIAHIALTRAHLALPILILSLSLMAPAASARGSAESGQKLAEEWCASCHQIDKGTKSTDAAPSFSSISERHGLDMSWVRAWLFDPHPPMTGINLSREQIDDIIAYLNSLNAAESQ